MLASSLLHTSGLSVWHLHCSKVRISKVVLGLKSTVACAGVIQYFLFDGLIISTTSVDFG